MQRSVNLFKFFKIVVIWKIRGFPNPDFHFLISLAGYFQYLNMDTKTVWKQKICTPLGNAILRKNGAIFWKGNLHFRLLLCKMLYVFL